MTGEVYAALKGHTILGRLMRDDGGSERGFLAGVEAARKAGPAGNLLHHFFSVRTLGLFDLLPPDELPEYLSGLLIGAEILAAGRPGQSVTILASEELGRRYGKAADALGLAWTAGPADSVVRGLAAVARAAGLIGEAS
jgi:2-dehydro-3-deoxygalactonokinase